jgi:hypothetical protein
VVLGVGLKSLSNYTNHVAETPLDTAFQPLAWSKAANTHREADLRGAEPLGQEISRVITVLSDRARCQTAVVSQMMRKTIDGLINDRIGRDDWQRWDRSVRPEINQQHAQKAQLVLPSPKTRTASVLMIKGHTPFIDGGERDVGRLKPSVKIYRAMGSFVNSASDIALFDHDLEMPANKMRERTCGLVSQPPRLIK